MPPRRIMHVDLDAFFVSVEQVLNPALRGKPVVVGGRPGGRGVVAAASYEARRYGLHSGMPIATAARLCPRAIFIEGNFKRYRQASRRFMAILADFSPFLEPGGLDEAYLDVTGFESLHGSIRSMASSIKERVRRELGLPASIGIAGSKIVAKVASDCSKPDGLLEVSPGEDAAFLAPLPIEKLPGIGRRTQQRLHELAVRTLGDLARLPVETLRARFGVYGEVLHRHARGIDERPVLPPGEARSISRETTFERDVRLEPVLEATLRYLGERVGAELRQRGKQARTITLKLRYSDFTTITRSRTLPHPTDTDQTVYQTGADLMKRALAADRRPVRLIGIGVSNLVEPGRQLELLPAPEQRLEQLNRAIDRIRDRYGFSAIQTGRTLLLRDLYPPDEDGDYRLHTPGLSR